MQKADAINALNNEKILFPVVKSEGIKAFAWAIIKVIKNLLNIQEVFCFAIIEQPGYISALTGSFCERLCSCAECRKQLRDPHI